ncbi:MAG: hypothetical protein AVDCRST_MAG17-1600 [uncultured Solirubrobacterales bacterium]|uniref:PAS domain-containing protein n=1 Tax=uncultured Solirubrobacterales bacterium TaxID=768556 RepID=A0A6J4ST74_9ACTN|nr:MAG: hypothetical protein AVDCRST_MAG17-1600 [uncultured Solirubrobacterales bacterium]
MELKTDGTGLEEALADSENRFRCLVESASDGFLLYDEEGRVVDVNSSACAACGYPRAELTGLTLRDLFAAHASVDDLTEVDETMCGGGARTVEVTARARTAARSRPRFASGCSTVARGEGSWRSCATSPSENAHASGSST